MKQNTFSSVMSSITTFLYCVDVLVLCVCMYVRLVPGGASKAGLKKAKDRKQERKAKKEEAAEISSGGGDLLSDLSAALGRRRKAMSGKDKDRDSGRREEKKDDHSLGGGSMMDNISRMIPAPPKAVPGGDGSGEESGDADW